MSSLQQKIVPELWFADLKRCYRSAANRTSEEEIWFDIAELRVRFRFAGKALQRVYCPAFAHLTCSQPVSSAGKAPDLTVNFFAEEDAYATLPPAPGVLEDFSPRGDIRGFNNEHFKAAFQPFGKILSAYLLREKQAILCVGDLNSVYNFERAAPIRPILGWLMREHGRQLAHAAVVAHQGQGLLLAGKKRLRKIEYGVSINRSGPSVPKRRLLRRRVSSGTDCIQLVRHRQNQNRGLGPTSLSQATRRSNGKLSSRQRALFFESPLPEAGDFKMQFKSGAPTEGRPKPTAFSRPYLSTASSPLAGARHDNTSPRCRSRSTETAWNASARASLLPTQSRSRN